MVGPMEPSKLSKLSNSQTYFSCQTEISFTPLHWKIGLMCRCESAGILDILTLIRKKKQIHNYTIRTLHLQDHDLYSELYATNFQYFGVAYILDDTFHFSEYFLLITYMFILVRFLKRTKYELYLILILKCNKVSDII